MRSSHGRFVLGRSRVRWTVPAFVVSSVVLSGCGGSGDDAPTAPQGLEFGGFDENDKPYAALEEGEWLPGGTATNEFITGDKAFSFPAANLQGTERMPFFTGNAFFNESWVIAPSSTTARDGIGPIFNARSCSGCHFKDGRGRPPEPGQPLESMLFRLSVPGNGDHGGPKPDPSYGGQLQPFGIEGVDGEGAIDIEYDTVRGEYADGTEYALRAPTYKFVDLAYGDPDEDIRMSPRVAPQVIGMGLLEAIPDEALEQLADAGEQGHLNRVWDATAEKKRIGRFGWKAEQPSVAQQVAGAFLGDMGITSPIFTVQNCTDAQTACQQAESGGEPEIEATLFERVVFYAQVLAPPAREYADDVTVLRGKWLFSEAGCSSCHTPSFVTGEHEVSQLEDQTIWPYTDLQLHDMGEGLADGRPTFEATGQEWRTPPLWGIGHFEDVNGHTLLLHDGRARGVAEAILWHGGEAESSRDAFVAMDEADRGALVRFVESL